MANVYLSALEGLLLGTWDLMTADVACVALTTGTTYDSGDEFLADIDDFQVGDLTGLITIDSVTGGLVTSTASIPLTGIGDGTLVVAIATYIETGSPATSPLLCWENRKADLSALSFTGTGNDLLIEFPAGKIFSI
jgi:hypothetical protein